MGAARLGSIRKEWRSSSLFSLESDLALFHVRIDRAMASELKAAVVAAVILIDLVFFERGRR